MITNEQWSLIDQKYGRLLTTICNNISGDIAIASFDDNLQDLRIATMEAVSGFAKKEGKTFDDFWGTTGFNKYMKTCLWNLKNKKGARISKRYNINKNTVDITEYNEILMAENQDSSSVSTFTNFFQGTQDKLSEEQKNLISTVEKNPKLVKGSGTINVRQLSQELGCCSAKTKKILDSIRTQINLEL
jgi:hypothetical protein|tara:strand:+ start:1888 stop:2451 length:564 start_codon:yes stop_codon:yes gene_type:complete